MTRRCCCFYVFLCCFHHSWIFTLVLLLHYFPLAKHERRRKAALLLRSTRFTCNCALISAFKFFSSSSITLLLSPLLVYIYPHPPTNPRQALSLRFLQKDHATQIRHNRHTVIPPPKAPSFPPPLLIIISLLLLAALLSCFPPPPSQNPTQHTLSVCSLTFPFPPSRKKEGEEEEGGCYAFPPVLASFILLTSSSLKPNTAHITLSVCSRISPLSSTKPLLLLFLLPLLCLPSRPRLLHPPHLLLLETQHSTHRPLSMLPYLPTLLNKTTPPPLPPPPPMPSLPPSPPSFFSPLLP